MQFKLDENLHPELAKLLTQHGHDALTVADQKLQGCLDQRLAAVCQEECRILVTLDLGFANIQAYPPEEYAGIIVLRVSHQSRHSLLQVMKRIIPLLESEPIEKRLWIVDENQIRVRSGEEG